MKLLVWLLAGENYYALDLCCYQQEGEKSIVTKLGDQRKQTLTLFLEFTDVFNGGGCIMRTLKTTYMLCFSYKYIFSSWCFSFNSKQLFFLYFTFIITLKFYFTYECT